jgi:hypothetical protein
MIAAKMADRLAVVVLAGVPEHQDNHRASCLWSGPGNASGVDPAISGQRARLAARLTA